MQQLPVSVSLLFVIVHETKALRNLRIHPSVKTNRHTPINFSTGEPLVARDVTPVANFGGTDRFLSETEKKASGWEELSTVQGARSSRKRY